MPNDEIRFRRRIEEAGYSILYHVLTLDGELSDQAFRLYSLLLEYAQQGGKAWPGVERLAENLGKSKKSVKRALAELRRRGLISRQRRFGTSTITYIEDPNDVYGDLLAQMCEGVKNDPSNVFVIGAQNEFARDWLGNRLLTTAERILVGIVGHPVEVRFVVAHAE